MEKSMIINLLHKIPHINVSLHMVNSTFNPNSDVYIEVSDELLTQTFLGLRAGSEKHLR